MTETSFAHLRPKSLDDDIAVQDAVAGLLRRVPERWEPFQMDDLPTTESRSLLLMHDAGFVQLKSRIAVRSTGFPDAMTFSLWHCGVGGFDIASTQSLDRLLSEWTIRSGGEPRPAGKLIVDRASPHEWRLSEPGVAARRDSAKGSRRPLLFVTRSDRPPVQGYGGCEVVADNPAKTARTSPVMDAAGFIELMQLNGKKRFSDRTISRLKTEWGAVSVDGTNHQQFWFDLATLDAKNVKYNPKWNEGGG